MRKVEEIMGTSFCFFTYFIAAPADTTLGPDAITTLSYGTGTHRWIYLVKTA
jgi:hypothetical protein